MYGCPTSACTTCPNSVWLSYQCWNNLSEQCMVVLPMLVQLVRTVYGFPTSACTTCPNSVWLSDQCLNNLSEKCVVILPVLVQIARTVYGCSTNVRLRETKPGFEPAVPVSNPEFNALTNRSRWPCYSRYGCRLDVKHDWSIYWVSGSHPDVKRYTYTVHWTL